MTGYGVFLIANSAGNSSGGLAMLIGLEIAALGLVCDIGGTAVIAVGEMRRIKYRRYLNGIGQLKSLYPENEVLVITE